MHSSKLNYLLKSVKIPKRHLIHIWIYIYLHYTAQSPDVWFTAVALLVEDLRGQVVGSSTDCLPSVSCRLQLGSKTKVAHFQLHRLVHKEVTWRQNKTMSTQYATQDKKHVARFRVLTKFQISVKDLLLVQVPQSRDNLPQIITHLWLSKHFASLQDMG